MFFVQEFFELALSELSEDVEEMEALTQSFESIKPGNHSCKIRTKENKQKLEQFVAEKDKTHM